MIRKRGQFYNRRYWGIDMNKARQFHLGAYSQIDSIYHLIKNECMKYRCWNYLHLPIIHAMSLSVVADYDIYLEVADVELDQT